MGKSTKVTKRAPAPVNRLLMGVTRRSHHRPARRPRRRRQSSVPRRSRATVASTNSDPATFKPSRRSSCPQERPHPRSPHDAQDSTSIPSSLLPSKAVVRTRSGRLNECQHRGPLQVPESRESDPNRGFANSTMQVKSGTSEGNQRGKLSKRPSGMTWCVTYHSNRAFTKLSS